MAQSKAERGFDFPFMSGFNPESVMEGFGSFNKGFEQAASFHLKAMDAALESAALAGKGFEKVHSGLVAYGRQALEEQAEALKTVMAAKTAADAMEAQQRFVKGATDSFVAEMTKAGELLQEAMREASAPLNDTFKGMFAALTPARA